MAAGLKEVLSQYCDIQEEIKDIKRRIERLERQLAQMEEDGYEVVDSVKGGSGGTQHFKIQGYPYPAYTRLRTSLLCRQQQLQYRENMLLEQTNIVEEFINKIEKSSMRRMITYRFLDSLTWVQVAYRMGGKYTAESCQKTVERFLKK